MNNYYNKYLKYKAKYSELKDKISQMKGGQLSNLKNMLVMGAGPIGLLNTLALLTRYPYNKSKKDINSIDSNNIFLVGKENPWRPQIFFLQNSFREYDSIDFIRDIDIETYKQLEQIGCYIGSPPSTTTPYCFSTYDNKTDKNYIESELAKNKSSIKAPSQIINNVDIINQPLYLMHHLSFQVSDFETILLNRILQINDENINFYTSHQKFIEVETKINDFLSRLEKDITNCSVNLFKALVIKKHLILTGQIQIDQFKPLVILLHPINKYCNINTYFLFKLYSSDNIKKEEEEEAIQFYNSNLKKEYISNSAEIKTGNSFTNLWDIKVTSEGSIYLKTKSDSLFAHKDLKYCKSKKICTEKGEIIFLNSEDYNYIFEAESKNKQFGSKSDYYYLKNRNDMTIESKNKFILKVTPLLAKSLDKNHVIEVHTDNIHKYFIITNKTINNDNDNITIEFTIRQLIQSPSSTNLHDMTIKTTDEKLTMVFPIKNISDSLPDEYNNIIKNEKINYIFRISLHDESDLQVNSTIKILRHLYKQEFNLILSYLGEEIKVTQIKKINTLAFKEESFDLSKTNPDVDALVYASVWMFKANEDNNKMFYSDKLKSIEKLDELNSSTIINNIPLCSGDICVNTNQKYYDNFNTTLKTKKRIDKKSIPNQIYINNDQVQYFNNNMANMLDSNSVSGLIHQDNTGNNPQHVFRVFGVNLHKDKIKNKMHNQKLEQNIEISSNKKFYYTGLQVSTEINSLLRKFKNDIPTNNFKKYIILKTLYIISFLYSQPVIDVDNDIYGVINLNDDPEIKKVLNYIDTEWDDTYGNQKPKSIKQIIETPINETFANVFPITLRYKVNTIETQEVNGNSKKIFNMGDSNTTVNFFSGTGLNTGILNIKKILNDYRNDLSFDKIQDLNKSYEISNRRTIYNSLLSSQNSTFLSVQRIFKLDSDEFIGPFIRNISNKSKSEIDEIINKYNIKFNDVIKAINDNLVKFRLMNIRTLLSYFDNFYKVFIVHENEKKLKNKTDIDFKEEMINDEKSDYAQIFKALKWNLFVCLYNLIENPVLGPTLDYEKESISYLNNLIYNYSDFCNFNRKKENLKYYCDALENSTEPIEYDPTRSEGLLRSYEFST